MYLQGELAKGNMKASTVDCYESALKKHLIPAFGHMDMRAISAEMVERFAAEKATGGMAPRSVTSLLLLLGVMFQYAIRHKYASINPTKGVKKGKAPTRRIQPLSFEDVPTFLAAAEADCYALFLTAIMTRMRQGELFGLQWGDIDWANGLIHVRRGVYRGSFTTPKSERSERAVVIPPQLVRVLEEHRVACLAYPNRHDLVFPNSEGGVWATSNLLKRRFYPALRRAKLAKRAFHDLRHTYASMAIRKNQPIKFIQKQLGHSSIQTTLDIYGHLLPETVEDARERIGEIFDEVASTSVRLALDSRDKMVEISEA